jgi:hypothetical protein
MELPQFVRESRGEDVEIFVNPDCVPMPDGEPFEPLNPNSISKIVVRYVGEKNLKNPPGMVSVPGYYSLELGESVVDARREYMVHFTNGQKRRMFATPDNPTSEILEQLFLNASRE